MSFQTILKIVILAATFSNSLDPGVCSGVFSSYILVVWFIHNLCTVGHVECCVCHCVCSNCMLLVCLIHNLRNVEGV